jgi:hypothetical protein
MDWYDPETEQAEGKEYSKDLVEDLLVITALGLENEQNIYGGGFDVREEWIPTLQSVFNHLIAPEQFDH